MAMKHGYFEVEVGPVALTGGHANQYIEVDEIGVGQWQISLELEGGAYLQDIVAEGHDYHTLVIAGGGIPVQYDNQILFSSPRAYYGSSGVEKYEWLVTLEHTMANTVVAFHWWCSGQNYSPGGILKFLPLNFDGGIVT